MKRLLTTLTTLILGTLVVTPAVSAQMPIPQPDENGNYPRTSHPVWKVVDLDEHGLNCRWSETMPKEWSSPAAPLPDLNIKDWSIVRRFESGTLLTANLSPAGFAFINDNRNLPWLKVHIGNNDQICLVRANERFIVPLPILENSSN